MSGESVAVMDDGVDENLHNSNKLMTNIVYALQAASFLFGFTLFVAVIVNYLKMRDVRGSWLESHFRWQIRTFWFSLLWTGLGLLALSAMFMASQNLLIFAAISPIIFINALWVIYRIARGWIRLSAEQSMYSE